MTTRFVKALATVVVLGAGTLAVTSAALAADPRGGMAAGDTSGYARINNSPRDPYTDGARIDKRDPYTDGARMGGEDAEGGGALSRNTDWQPDGYARSASQGQFAGQVAGRDLTGVSAEPGKDSA